MPWQQDVSKRSAPHTSARASTGTLARARGLFASWSTRDIVVAAVLAVVVGVIFWGWDLAYSAFFSAIPFPASYAINGIWMIGGLMVPFIVRKPGAALFGELVAAFVSMALGQQWGILVMASGLAQGLGAELVFAGFRWEKFDGVALYMAALGTQFFGFILDTFVYTYYKQFSPGLIGVGMVVALVSSVILGGLLSHLLGEALVRTGVLSGLAISRERAKRV
jgi:energy-coupling factor transport system permease protein